MATAARVRWLIATVIFVVVTGVVVASYFPGVVIKSCHGELASGGSVVQVCGPIGLGDAVAVALVLGLAALLVWPELSELSIGNVLSFKRRLESTEKRQEQTEKKQEQTAALATAATAAATRATDDVRALSLADQPPPVDAVAKAQVGLAHAFIVREQPIRSLSGERADSEKALLDAAATLDRVLSITSGTAPGADLADAHEAELLPRGDTTAQLAALSTWEHQFSEQLATWAQLRTQLVHFPERLTDEQVREGMRLTQTLLAAARLYAANRVTPVLSLPRG